MTMDDAFDARLRAAFAAAAERQADPEGFARRVLARIARRQRRRLYVLGAAGAAGALLAGTQLLQLFRNLGPVTLDAGQYVPGAVSYSPEALAAAALALMVAAFAFILPRNA